MPPGAQHLPSLVLERIVDYYVCNNSMFPSRALNFTVYELARPLARVCRSWRYVAISRAFQSANFGDKTSSSLQLAWALGVGDRVKEVVLAFGSTDAFEGLAMDKLLPFQPADVIFANVERLAVKFSGSSMEFNSRHFDENIRNLTGLVSRMFPAVSHIRVDHYWWHQSNTYPPFVHDLLHCLYAGRLGVATNRFWSDQVPNMHSDPSSLQSLGALAKHHTDRVFEIIHRNTQSLQAVKLVVDNHSLRMDGTTVSYPQLRSLQISCPWSGQEPQGGPDSLDNTPFLILEELIFHDLYPFSDDSLLCGTEKSLRYLYIYVTDEILERVYQFGLFNKGRFAKPDRVRLVSWTNSQPTATTGGVSHIFGAFYNVPIIEFEGGYNLDYQVICSHIGSIAQTARVLKIPGLRCTYVEILQLVQSLPYIEDISLHCVRDDVLGDPTGYSEISTNRRYRVEAIGPIKELIDDLCQSVDSGDTVPGYLQFQCIFPARNYCSQVDSYRHRGLWCPCSTRRNWQCLELRPHRLCYTFGDVR